MSGKSSSPDTSESKLISIQDIADHFYAQTFVPRPEDEKPFAEMCIVTFDARAVIKLLLDPNPTFYGHREAAFAAFLSWVISPADEETQLEFIGLAVKKLMAAAELAAEKLNLDYALHRDLAARYLIAGPQFIEQIYILSGGMVTLAEYGSPTITVDAFGLDRVPINTLNIMMAYCHYVADRTDAGQPSINRSIEMVGRIRGHGISSRSAIYTQWAKCKDNIALIYAASSIELNDGRRLLDALLDGDIDLSVYWNHLGTWMGRARYVCEHILRKMPDEQLYKNNMRPLRQLTSTEFPHRTFNSAESNAF